MLTAIAGSFVIRCVFSYFSLKQFLSQIFPFDVDQGRVNQEYVILPSWQVKL